VLAIVLILVPALSDPFGAVRHEISNFVVWSVRFRFLGRDDRVDGKLSREVFRVHLVTVILTARPGSCSRFFVVVSPVRLGNTRDGEDRVDALPVPYVLVEGRFFQSLLVDTDTKFPNQRMNVPAVVAVD